MWRFKLETFDLKNIYIVSVRWNFIATHRNLADGTQRIGIMHVQIFESTDEWMQVSRIHILVQLKISSVYKVVLNEVVGEEGEKDVK